MLFSGKCWLRLFKAAGQSQILESRGQFALCPALDETPGKFTYYLTLVHIWKMFPNLDYHYFLTFLCHPTLNLIPGLAIVCLKQCLIFSAQVMKSWRDERVSQP